MDLIRKHGEWEIIKKTEDLHIYIYIYNINSLLLLGTKTIVSAIGREGLGVGDRINTIKARTGLQKWYIANPNIKILIGKKCQP